MLSTRLFHGLGIAIIVAMPALFITTNVRISFQSQPLYTYAIDAFDAPERTGIGREELIKGMVGLIEYFESDDELITTEIIVDGSSEPLFTERESMHFRDVRDLLQHVYRVQAVTTLFILGVLIAAVIAVARDKPHLAAIIFRRLRQSAMGTGVIIVAVGLFAALGGFTVLFMQFHVLSFSNDLWQGSANDRMIQLFPETFFMQATLLIGLATIVEMAIVWLGATVSVRGLTRQLP